MADTGKIGRLGPDKKQPVPSFAKWSRVFLAELAATSNVTAAAKRAEVSTSKVYDTRRQNAEFGRKWQVALCEGYDFLEMEMLRRLREGEVKPVAGAVRSFDNATAFRLLSAHRESAARQRAFRDDMDADAILAGIDARLDRMRERSLAADEG
jgi:hypothetical protein